MKIPLGTKVRVALYPHNTYSLLVKKKDKWEVFGRSKRIYLENCQFFVDNERRELFLRTKKRNFHAYIEGNIQKIPEEIPKGWHITYNPRYFQSFVTIPGYFPIYECKSCVLRVNKPIISYSEKVES